MDRTPSGPPQGKALRGRLIDCLWWLIFAGSVAAGTAVGVMLALWLALAPPTGLLLIAACWLGGNAAGWTLAARADIAMRQRIRKNTKRIQTAIAEILMKPACGFLRLRSAGKEVSLGLACP